MTYTGKILFCCGIALYIYVARIIIYHDSKISRKEESASEDIASASEPMGLLAGQLLVVTRIHMNAASSLPDVSKVIKFVKDCKNYADGILVCIGAHEHSAAAANQLAEYTQSIQNLLRAEGLDKLNIYFLPISPWGYFTPALNYAVQFAQDHDFDNVAFQVRAKSYKHQFLA